MTGKQYQKGRSAEYYVKGRLQTQGATLILRSAGSHGPADLAAFFPASRQIKLIQVKTSKKGLTPKATTKELADLSRYEGTWEVRAGYYIRAKDGWISNL